MPLLSENLVLGEFLKNQMKIKRRSELLILFTARVLTNESEQFSLQVVTECGSPNVSRARMVLLRLPAGAGAAEFGLELTDRGKVRLRATVGTEPVEIVEP